MALVNLGGGSANQDEDYYMQELLTREQLHQSRMLEKPVASTQDRQDSAKRLPDRRAHKGAVDAKQGIETHCKVSILILLSCAQL